jgi:hypothetical protein
MGFPVLIPPGSLLPVSCVCCVMESSGLCYGLITRPEECYRARVCAALSVTRCNSICLHLQCVGVRGQTEKKEKRVNNPSKKNSKEFQSLDFHTTCYCDKSFDIHVSV